MGIQIITERWGLMVAGLVLGWIVAKVWSHKRRWAGELDSDMLWVRLWCLVGALIPLLEWRALLVIPAFIWAHYDAEKQARNERTRQIERAAHNKWWGETQYRWERQWDRIPRKGR